MSTPDAGAQRGVAVLASGGVDSAVLTAELLRDGRAVQPIYVRFGLAWEAVEESHLRRFLDTLSGSELRTLVTLVLPVADTYGAHWSLGTDDVPGEHTPDDAVYLPGRNLLLLAKSSIWCALHGVPTIALGTLKGNPFADSSREFFGDVAALVHTAVSHRLEIATPFRELDKAQVLERGRDLALEQTFSCIDPVGDMHCGRCNKCAERRRAFAEVSIEDATIYATLEGTPR
ncbi:MAG TPA: 7-cyano-7-deazaguanine synthase [Acidimicrobiia bacterium]|nr:7-cyano-7-deazaguanine synthase [Acidimicrobiia bacterium]